MQPKIITGNSHTDARGTLRFANEFRMDEVKRFYLVHHSDISVVRAWQAHKTEQKWFYVLEGAFKVVLVLPDNWEAPSEKLPVTEFDLDASDNKVLHIPSGFVNGFKALCPDSKMIIYTDSYIEDAPKDDLRFPPHYWYDWNKLRPL